MTRIQNFTRQGLRFDVLDQGPEDGPVVILLHGFPQDAHCWDQVAAMLNARGLRTLALDLRSRLGSDAAVAVVTGVANERPLVVVAVNDAARSAGLAAGQLVRTAASTLGGGGGGKPDVAQGGGSDASKIPDALEAVRRQIAAAV